ncbi:MAG: DNA-binding protein [Bacteroidetes bacterium]|nr:DNA-binding protein [Bacteroidota bacterium]
MAGGSSWVAHYGDPVLWSLPKTAFLCSRKVPAAQVLKCYDWAIAMREAGTCVMLGAHSPLEKDVLHYLLKGTQPVVLVLARGMKKKLEPELTKEVEKGRLLVVSPFPVQVVRVTAATAMERNRFMLEHARDVVIGHATPDGSLARLVAQATLPVIKL